MLLLSVVRSVPDISRELGARHFYRSKSQGIWCCLWHWGYSDIPAMTWKWPFFSKGLRVFESCQSIQSDILLCVQIDYLSPSSMTFCTRVCISQFRMSGACRDFALSDFLIVLWIARLCSFFVHFKDAGHKIGSNYFFRLLTVPIIQPFVSHLFDDDVHTTDYVRLLFFHRFLASRVPYLNCLIVLSWTQRLLSLNICIVFYVSFSLFSTIFLKNASNQPFPFLWLQPDSVDNTTSPPRSSSLVTSTSSLTLRNSSFADTTAVSTYPSLATKLPPQADVRIFSLQTIVTSPALADYSPIWAISKPARTVVSVSTRPSWKRLTSMSVHRLRSGFAVVRSFCTRLETHSICGLTPLSEQGGACCEGETNTFAILLPAASPVCTTRMEMSVFMFCFRY